MKSPFFILSLMTAAMLCAQPPGGHFGKRSNGGTPPSPQETAQRETNRLSQMLGLTTGQQSTVLGILTAENTSLQVNQAALQTGRTNLIAAVKANNTSQIDSILLQLSPLEEQQSAIRYKAAAAVYAALTSDQQMRLGNGLGMLLGGGPGFGRRP